MNVSVTCKVNTLKSIVRISLHWHYLSFIDKTANSCAGEILNFIKGLFDIRYLKLHGFGIRSDKYRLDNVVATLPPRVKKNWINIMYDQYKRIIPGSRREQIFCKFNNNCWNENSVSCHWCYKFFVGKNVGNLIAQHIT